MFPLLSLQNDAGIRSVLKFDRKKKHSPSTKSLEALCHSIISILLREKTIPCSQVVAAYLVQTRSQQTLFCIEIRQHLKLSLPLVSTDYLKRVCSHCQ